jgi:hypothetical protein
MPKTLWDLPNYSGELFTADVVNTPVLSAMGGLTSGGKQTTNFEFPVASQYTFPSQTQPAITEDDALTAPVTTVGVRSQIKNVTQIFHQAVRLTYEKLSNAGRLSGINTQGDVNNISDELAWQIDYNLKIIARNIEYTLINGFYQISTADDVANKTRGLIATTALSGGTVIDAGSASLSKALVQELLREMFENGAMFSNMVFIVNGFQKQVLSDIFGYAPEDRNVGGVNIKQIETDFGNIGILPAHRFMPTDGLLAVDMSVLSPVFQPVPNKGNFFYEQLAKTGASENGQIYGKFGLDHGPAFAHGFIDSLATA